MTMNLHGSPITVLTALAAAGTLACGGSAHERTPGVPPVAVTASTPATTTGFTIAPATVVAVEDAQLATRASGTIRRITVDVGARVAAGDTLVVLDTDEIDARIHAAEAAARLARRSYERIQALARDGATTDQELDDARARAEAAEASLRDARAQRKYVILQAPFDGVVTARSAHPGDLAAPGVPVLTLVGVGALKIQADLSADLVEGIVPGQRAAVLWPERNVRYLARVTRVVPAVDPTTRRFRVELRFEPSASETPRVPPGTFVRVELPDPGTATRWIPADAVVRRGQLVGVYVVEDDTLHLRWVRPGRLRGDAVELLAGPADGSLIVRRPATGLLDGQPVSAVHPLEWAPAGATTPAATPEHPPSTPGAEESP